MGLVWCIRRLWRSRRLRFRVVKQLLAEVHEVIGHEHTLCCGCAYEGKGKSGGDLDREACGLKARRNDKRSDQLEWEHVVSVWRGGKDRACWKEGHALCVKADGRPFKGRRCCMKPGVDEAFRAFHNDPHNLFPASGEINGDRSNLPFGEVKGEDREYGACDFEVGGEPKRAEPGELSRGELARAMLYVRDRHGVPLYLSEAELLEWHRAYLPEPWECARAALIRERTGLAQLYVVNGTERCPVFGKIRCPIFCTSRDSNPGGYPETALPSSSFTATLSIPALRLVLSR